MIGVPPYTSLHCAFPSFVNFLSYFYFLPFFILFLVFAYFLLSECGVSLSSCFLSEAQQSVFQQAVLFSDECSPTSPHTISRVFSNGLLSPKPELKPFSALGSILNRKAFTCKALENLAKCCGKGCSVVHERQVVAEQ
jgi:hypothetical protein